MTLHRIAAGYGRLLYGLGVVGALATFAMMALVVANAASRYALNAPVQGAFEIVQSLLTIMVFLSLALTQHRGGHIRVSVITRRMPAALARLAEVAAPVLGAVFFAWCAYGAWGLAMQSYAMDEQEWGVIRYPLYPVKFVVFAGLVLLAVQFLMNALAAATGKTITPESGQ